MTDSASPGYDVAIIGGGVLGTAISYWISSTLDADVCLVEKEHNVAMHASGRNTAVVHSPFYLDPDTRGVLARSALVSHSMWRDLAETEGVPWRRTGVLELALDGRQHKKLEQYMCWGIRNGIPPGDLELLDGSRVSRMEPNIECHSAIHCTREASTDFGALTGAVRTASERNGTDFVTGRRVTAVPESRGGSEVVFADGSSITARLVINCAGGNSLDIAKLLGAAAGYSDLHFRGEYWEIDPIHADLAGTTIYTVAEFQEYPFLDPHWIKRADGRTEVGPNAVPVPGPETYDGYVGNIGTSLEKLRDILTGSAKRLLADPDFLSLISKEWQSSLFKTAMIGRVRRFMPKLRPEFFTRRGTAGIRSPVITPEGRFVPDVMELETERSFSIVNYNSPGATGAPAYSALVVKKLIERGFLDHAERRRESIWDFDDTIDQA